MLIFYFKTTSSINKYDKVPQALNTSGIVIILYAYGPNYILKT